MIQKSKTLLSAMRLSKRSESDWFCHPLLHPIWSTRPLRLQRRQNLIRRDGKVGDGPGHGDVAALADAFGLQHGQAFC